MFSKTKKSLIAVLLCFALLASSLTFFNVDQFAKAAAGDVTVTINIGDGEVMGVKSS